MLSDRDLNICAYISLSFHRLRICLTDRTGLSKQNVESPIRARRGRHTHCTSPVLYPRVR